MPYSIQKTNGGIITVEDGAPNTSTSLTLIGKNYPGYGYFLNQNFVKLLENFSNDTEPSNPLQGQLFWDSTEKQLNVYDGTRWKVISSAMDQADAPTNPVRGDIWWDTANNQLKVYPGGVNRPWVVIGPAFTAATGITGAIGESIRDSLNAPRTVIKFYVDQTLVGILSKETTSFTPYDSTMAPGFATISPGFNLLPGLKYIGTATDSDAVGGVPVSNIPKLNQANTFTSGQQNFRAGINVGQNSELGVSIGSGTVNLNSAVAGNDIVVQIAGSEALRIKSNRQVEVDVTTPTSDKGVATKAYVEAAISGFSSSQDLASQLAVFSTTAYVDNQVALTLKKDGSVDLTGSLLPSANNSISLGSSTKKFATVYATSFAGTSTSALYADLAERFEADTSYVPGTVVELGGTAEITKVGQELSESVFGVISTRAAYLMNAGAGDDATHPPVAVSGRVPVRVIGTVRKGDRLVSAGNGLARAAKREEMTPWNVIGRALSNKETTGEGIVEAIVKLNS